MLGAGFAMALAGLMGTAQATAPISQATTQNEIKSTPAKVYGRSTMKIHSVGGMDLVTFLPNYGISPKEYGIKYGHGNRKGKSNRLRLSHNAKLRRR